MVLFNLFSASKNKTTQRNLNTSKNRANKIADIEATIIAHNNWRINFHAFFAGKMQHLTPENVACDHRCDLGKWLYGSGQQNFGQSAIFAELSATHKQFHEATAKVVLLAQNDQRAEAHSLLTGKCARLSEKIQTRLEDLKSMV